MEQTKNGAIADVELDPQILQTPEFDREFSSSLHTSNIPSARKEYKTPACSSLHTSNIPSARKEYKTPACKSVGIHPSRTSKKAYARDLCSLTGSLVKKKSVGKALQFRPTPRQNVVSIYIYHVAFARDRI
jgi:hypothetical protein